jgi:hypothetical protein
MRKVRLQVEALEGRCLPSISFASPANYTVGQMPNCIATGDLTGNGIQDLVVGNRILASVSILMGNGDGTFQTPITLNSEGDVNSVAVADLTGNGIRDIVSSGYSPPASST